MPGAFSRFRITSKISLWKARFCLNPRFIAISPYINSIEVLKLVEEFNKTLL